MFKGIYENDEFLVEIEELIKNKSTNIKKVIIEENETVVLFDSEVGGVKYSFDFSINSENYFYLYQREYSSRYYEYYKDELVEKELIDMSYYIIDYAVKEMVKKRGVI